MRVLFIGRNHGFSLVPLQALAEGHELAALVESEARPAPGDRARRGGGRARPSALATIAAERGLPHLLLARENRGELPAFVAAARPDLIAVASLTQLLAPEVLALPRHGAINLHPSLLPRWPGPYPWLWQYLAFEREIGVTVHGLDAGEDTGPIYAQEALAVAPGTPLAELQRQVEPIGARLLRRVADELAAGTATPRPQGPRTTPRARRVERDEPLIDFAGWELDHVWHALRGALQWLDAVAWPQGLWRGARWEILEPERGPCGDPPGAVRRDARGWYVAHRDGKIRVRPRLRLARRLRNLFRRA